MLAPALSEPGTAGGFEKYDALARTAFAEFRLAASDAAAIRAEEALILEAEGPYHVGGKYQPAPSNGLARHQEATRRVRSRAEAVLRLSLIRAAVHIGATLCAWCSGRIGPAETAVEVGDKVGHATCALELSAISEG